MGQRLTTVVHVAARAPAHPPASAAAGVPAVVRDRAEPYEGEVVEDHGDRLVLTFASPRSAVAFSVAAQQACPDGPALRIGMDFGDVGGAGAPGGDAAEAAARIVERAHAGEVLVTDVVCRLAGSLPGIRYVDRGRLKLKGLADRWHVHAVVGAADAVEAAPVFGRDEELHRVDALVSSVLAGEGDLVVLEGEAGIGKSHLARAVLARAAAGGVAAVAGGADELERDQPGRILAGLVQGLGLPFDELVDAGGSDRGADPAHAVIERFVDAVEDAAARRPVLLVAEDLHWADELSLRGLAGLVRRMGPLPVGLVVTLRPVPRGPSVHHLLEVCARSGGQLLRLEGLDAAAVASLVASVTGAAPGAALRRRLESTAGNPLYVSELLRALEDDGALRVASGVADTDSERLPEGLVQTLNRRIAALPAATAEVLRLASLLGGEFSLEDLATVAGRSMVELAATLRDAVDGALVVGQGQALRFRHDLIREAVYLGVAPAIRSDLHVAAGRALAGAGAPAAKVARQFALGARGGDPVAAGWLLRAAGEALRLDTSTAVSIYEQALALAPREWPERVAVESLLVELLAWTGRVDDARSLAQSLLDRSLTPAEELQARRAFAAVLATTGDLAGAVAQLDAAAALPEVPDSEHGVLRCASAGMSVIAGLATPADAEAVARAHVDTGDAAVACWARNTLAVAAVASGAYDDVVEHARKAVRLLEATYVPPLGFLIPQTWLPVAHLNLDDYAEAEAATTEARLLAERRGDVGLISHATALTAGMHVIGGAWDDGASHAEAGLELADETGVGVMKVFLHAVEAQIAIGKGDWAAAEEHLAAGEAFFAANAQHPFGLDLLLWGRADLLEIQGDPAAAANLMRLVWGQTATIRGLVQWRILGPHLVRLLRETGDAGAAATVAGEVAEVAGRSPAVSGRAAQLRAAGLAAQDPEALVAGAELLRSTGHRVERAMACTDAGLLLLRVDRVDEGTALLDEAADLYLAMGATGRVARIDATLRAAGVRRRRSQPAAATHGWEALSPKEREVVDLVAAGLSNPRIADKLYISRRTVETHLSHVFRKLGLSNRTQLATAAMEHAQRA